MGIIMQDLKEAYGGAKARLKKGGGAAGFARRMGYNVPLPKKKKKKRRRRGRTKTVIIYK